MENRTFSLIAIELVDLIPGVYTPLKLKVFLPMKTGQPKSSMTVRVN